MDDSCYSHFPTDNPFWSGKKFLLGSPLNVSTHILPLRTLTTKIRSSISGNNNEVLLLCLFIDRKIETEGMKLMSYNLLSIVPGLEPKQPGSILVPTMLYFLISCISNQFINIRTEGKFIFAKFTDTYQKRKFLSWKSKV